jgi:4-hydroxy-tetrahydrodipicolinate synthase
MTGWRGVFPAITTQFKSDQSIDMAATAASIEHQLKAGVNGLIMCGSLCEASTLDAEEKRTMVKLAIDTARGRVPVLAGTAETTTKGACKFAEDVARLGGNGLMLLPGMIYKSDRRETIAHYRTVARATDLPIMVYNNPPAYGVDITPEMFAELADEKTLVAIKESSDNVRRITDIVNLCGDRYILFCGVDDLILESLMLGAVGWVAGLVNAFPEETVQLYRLAQKGRYEEARALYRWFMPLLHLDVSVKLVQYIKLAQSMTGTGTENVRAPRLPLVGAERERIKAIIQKAIEPRPKA